MARNKEKLNRWQRAHHHKKKNDPIYIARRKDYYERNKEKAIETAKRWKKKNPDKIKEISRKYLLGLRMTALENYGGKDFKCKCCGQKKIEFLCIDHINNNGAEHRKSIKRAPIYSWLKQNNYPKGLVTPKQLKQLAKNSAKKAAAKTANSVVVAAKQPSNTTSVKSDKSKSLQPHGLIVPSKNRQIKKYKKK